MIKSVKYFEFLKYHFHMKRKIYFRFSYMLYKINDKDLKFFIYFMIYFNLQNSIVNLIVKLNCENI